MAVPGEDQPQGPLTEEWGEQWSPGSGAAGSPRGFRRRPENVQSCLVYVKKKVDTTSPKGARKEGEIVSVARRQARTAQAYKESVLKEEEKTWEQ